MKLLLKSSALFLLTGIFLGISCLREKIYGPDLENKPPVANAGVDQILYLPTNGTMVDGSLSTDPENNIAKDEWAK